MATVKQFNDVWMDWSEKCCKFFLTEEAKAEIRPLFRELAVEFQRQFGVDIQQSLQISQDLEITGATLEKLKAWCRRISQGEEEDYMGWCGFLPMPNIR